MPEIKQGPGSFYIGEDPGQPLAKVDVARRGDVLVIIHTEVSEALKGQGIGQQLVKHVVDYSRENNLTVVVKCPFARRMFERNPDYHDVLRGRTL